MSAPGLYTVTPPTRPVYQAARDPKVQLPLAKRALAHLTADYRERGCDEPTIASIPSIVAAKARVERWS